MATRGEYPLSAASSQARPMQVAALVASGIALWFLAALMLRYLVPQGAFDGYRALLSYALVVPGTVPFVHGIRIVGGLAHNRVAYGVTVATASALLMDGIAVRWFPTLYGANAADVATAAGAVLWGAGVALALGLVMNRRNGTDV